MCARIIILLYILPVFAHYLLFVMWMCWITGFGYISYICKKNIHSKSPLSCVYSVSVSMQLAYNASMHLKFILSFTHQQTVVTLEV